MQAIKKFIFFLGCSLGLLFLITVGAITACVYFVSNSDFSLSSLTEAKTENAVGVVELVGEIITADKFSANLKKQIEDEQIKAVVVRIDSPGGTVGASEEIYREIKEANTKKPVVCSLGNLAASGGLFASQGCEKIVTNKGTITGSIGVVMMLPNVSTFLNGLGVGMNTIKSGEFKDAGSPFKQMTEADKQVFQSVVMLAYEQFVSVIADSRGLPIENVKSFADGRVILGEEARRLGLVDEFGGIREAARIALKKAKTDLGLEDVDAEPEIIMPSKKKGLAKFLEDGLEGAKMIYWLKGLTEYRLFYRAGF